MVGGLVMMVDGGGDWGSGFGVQGWNFLGLCFHFSWRRVFLEGDKLLVRNPRESLEGDKFLAKGTSCFVGGRAEGGGRSVERSFSPRSSRRAQRERKCLNPN